MGKPYREYTPEDIYNMRFEITTLRKQLDQLKAKEQECERLKRDYFKQNEWLQEQKKELDQLKGENEELKKQLAELISQSALLPKFFGLSAEEITQLTTKCSKLYQTLTEIKEIAENAEKRMYATISDDYTEGYSWLGSIILQKLSEVEDEN